MTIRGARDIRGIRSLNTRPGPVTEKSGYLKLYQLAAEKDNLRRKVAWVERQKDQTEKRLSEIEYAIHAVRGQTRRESTSNSRAEFRSTFIEY